VVVVDQSVDGSAGPVVARAREAGLEVVHRHEPGRGLGLAQNTALAASTLELVAVLDDDCVADSGWIAALEVALGDSDVITGPVLALPPEGERILAVSTRTSLEPRSFGRRDLPWHVGSGNNFALRRSWFDAVGGCDTRLGPGSPGRGGVDMDLYRLLRAGAAIRYEPTAVVHHARTTREGRRSRRIPYGFGMGACCTLWLRDHDFGGARVLAAWIGFRFGLLACAVAARRWEAVREETLVLVGTAHGIVYGVRA
jgi:glycosyltransferase involved in cell wall biosynthesis